MKTSKLTLRARRKSESLTTRSARNNAIDALRRGDEPEFARLSLDYAGALDLLAHIGEVRAELRRLAR
jgi:hypothetical protein